MAHEAPSASVPPPVHGGFLRGIGEVAAFFGAAGWAVVELALGRWPTPRGTPRRKPAGVGPFPIND